MSPDADHGGRGHVVRAIADLPPALVRLILRAEKPSGEICAAAVTAVDGNDIDWHAIATQLEAQGLSMVAYQRLTDAGLADRIPEPIARAWASNARHAALQCDLQRDDAILVSDVLSELQVPHAFLKGFVYREWLYDPPWVRAGSDVDVLVSHDQVELVREAMLEIGFVQASRSWDFQRFRPATAREIRLTEAEHYELAQFARTLRLVNVPEWLFAPEFKRGTPFTYEKLPDGPVFHSVFDVHWALHFLFAEERLLDQLMFVTSRHDPELEIPTLNPEWTVFFTIFKLYSEAFDRPAKGLPLLMDLAALLSALASEVDWEQLAASVTKYGFESGAFYTLSAAERLLGVTAVPEALLDSWSTIAPRREDEPQPVDFGDFLPQVLQKRIVARFLPLLRRG